MGRVKIPQGIETKILTSSRRRCCICFGLNRDDSVKRGQIAHLDKNRSNNSVGNLAFLCLEHHDLYDSSTSQSKGLKIQEVKQYRAELVDFLGDGRSIRVSSGFVKIPKAEKIAGTYLLDSDDDKAAELFVTPLHEGPYNEPIYAVVGVAYWGLTRPFGPNLGEIRFIAELDDNELVYFGAARDQGDRHSFSIKFTQAGLECAEKGELGIHGLNVSFDGTYIKA